MHRPCSNPINPSANVARPSNGTQEGTHEGTHKSTQKKAEGISLSQCPLHQLLDTEPRLLLQTLLDWEEDYVHPPHVCHQKAENYLDQAEEEMGGSNSVLWENPATYDMMRELGNILKVTLTPPTYPPTQKYP